MTKLIANPTIYQQGGDLGQSAGTAPVGTGAMQGNPQDSQARQNMGTYPPGPQVGGTGQTINTPLVNDQIARGNVPLNAQPSNLVNAQPGTASLLALISSGQVSLNQSSYGQAHAVPQVGAGGQSSVIGTSEPQPQPTGPPNAVTVATATTYLGD